MAAATSGSWCGRYTAQMSDDQPTTRRVYMTFFLRQGWNVQFLEADLRTPLLAGSPIPPRSPSAPWPAGLEPWPPSKPRSSLTGKSRMAGVVSTWT
jgi:hypothetical protein